MTHAPEEAFILRTNAEGEVIGFSQHAEVICGRESLGVACDQVVKGKGLDGAAICREGCAVQLNHGELPQVLTREAVVRGRRVSLRCYKVGDEAVVVADPLSSADATERLTPRELQVLELVAQGLSSAKIATKLSISPATVRTHVEHARQRLGARTRAEAVKNGRSTLGKPPIRQARAIWTPWGQAQGNTRRKRGGMRRGRAQRGGSSVPSTA